MYNSRTLDPACGTIGKYVVCEGGFWWFSDFPRLLKVGVNMRWTSRLNNRSSNAVMLSTHLTINGQRM